MELEHLPTEILHHICLFVRDDSFHDLSSLSQASRRLFSIAAPIFYRNIIVHWDHDSDYGSEKAFSELHKTGLGRHYLKYARKLDLICHGPMTENISQSTKNVSLKFRNHRAEITEGSLLAPYLTESAAPGLDTWAMGHWTLGCIFTYNMSRKWDTGIAIMLKNMDKLVEFNYHLRNSFPKGIFDSIKEYHPFCKLNLLGNQFLALDEHDSRPPMGFEWIRYREPFQISILDFPTLESFTLYYPWKIQGASSGYVHDQYFLALARASNLKHLRIWNAGILEVIARPELETNLSFDHLDRRVSASILESLVFFGGRYQPLHHGRYLESLIIEPSGRLPPLDCQRIRELARLCPKIAELRVQITRSTGGTDEYDAYRALGDFPSLHTLFIDLQCDPRQQPLDIDADPPYEQIFRNAATDEALAMTIWDTITSHKVGKELRNLRCTPFGQPFYTDTLNCVLFTIGKSLLVKRLDFQGPNSLEITAIGEDQRRRRVKKYLGLTGVDVEAGEDYIQDKTGRSGTLFPGFGLVTG